MFVSGDGSNVRRALARKITRDKFQEGGNMADWMRCVCHLLHNVVSHGLGMVDVRATNSEGSRKLNQALARQVRTTYCKQGMAAGYGYYL